MKFNVNDVEVTLFNVIFLTKTKLTRLTVGRVKP